MPRRNDVGEADLERFAALHAAVQQAWNEGDLEALRRLTTPAMAAWFEGEIERLAREGLRNVVAGVAFLAAEPREARREGDTEYATALLRWRALDYLVRTQGAQAEPEAVGGDPRTPVEIEEMWTFARRGEGDWRLSAIHQV
ncbi:MAG TPA: TIM44-like domain-containing protein [Stellaceae bacterium]|nr:TIM44-like domain-containing protein [Stellaceae bacterium]